MHSNISTDILNSASLPRLLLQHLDLNDLDDPKPALLKPLTALQHLSLQGVPLTDGNQGLSAFLALLPKLQHLTHLTVRNLGDAADRTAQSFPRSAAFSALTASGKLRALTVVDSNLDDTHVLRAPAWRHMFPTMGRVLRHLTSLEVVASECVLCSSDLWLLQAWKSNVPGPGRAGKMPQPRSVDIKLPHSVTDEGLLQLTSLRRLTRLALSPYCPNNALSELGISQELGLTFLKKFKPSEPCYQLELSNKV